MMHACVPDMMSEKDKIDHSTMLTHRKGAHMRLTWHAKYPSIYMDEFDPKRKHEGSDLFNSLGTKMILTESLGTY